MGNDPTLAANRPRTIPLADVAAQVGLPAAAIRRAITQDTDEQLPDHIRRIPGGRNVGASFYIIRKQYELVVGLPEPIDAGSLLRKRAG